MFKNLNMFQAVGAFIGIMAVLIILSVFGLDVTALLK